MPESEKLRNIKAIVFDVDGIFTDGLSWQDETGRMRRYFCVRDAMGTRALKKAGYSIAVVSSTDAPEIREHMNLIGLLESAYGNDDKTFFVSDFLSRKKLSSQECAIVTVREQDLKMMQHLGCAITVPTAPAMVKAAAAIITTKPGGDGAVLEVCNRLLLNGAFADSYSSARSGRRAIS